MTKYDLVIYGASGFTGQFVIEYVHRAAKVGCFFKYLADTFTEIYN